jgi:hypothetical protein
MVMARCRECGSRVGAEEARCPHCGAIRPVDLSVASGWADEPAAVGTSGKTGSPKRALAITVFAMGIFAIVLVWSGALSIEALLTAKIVIAALAAALVVWWLIIRAQAASERTSIKWMGGEKPANGERAEENDAN